MKHILGVLLASSGCTIYFGTNDPPDASDPPGSDASSTVDGGSATGHRMFVTSSTYQGGALGGPFGTDAICQQHANAAALGGYWSAWLSGVAWYPGLTMAHYGGDYVLVDGTVVAHGWSGLVDGVLLHAINLDEHGAVHQAPPSCMLAVAAWTNTKFDGTPHTIPNQDYSCGNWQDLNAIGALGNVNAIGPDWTDYPCSIPCTGRAALYCIEQ